MAVRTILRRYPGGTSFGGTPPPAMGTFGGSFSPLSTWTDPRTTGAAEGDPNHPYFKWLAAHPDKVYGQASYGEWAATLPAGASVDPNIPPQPPQPANAGAGYHAQYPVGTEDPNDPSNPNFIPPSPGGGAVYMGRDANGTQFIWRLPDGRTFATDAHGQLIGQVNPAPTGAGGAAGGAGTTVGAGTTGGGAAAGADLAPTATAGATTSPAGGSGPTTGQKVSGTTSSGRTVSGEIVSSANGTTVVRWDDGTVSNYDSGGNLLSSTPPAAVGGAAAPAAGGGGAATGSGSGLPATSTTGDVYGGSTADQVAAPVNTQPSGSMPAFDPGVGARTSAPYSPVPVPQPIAPAPPVQGAPVQGAPDQSMSYVGANGQPMTLEQLLAQYFASGGNGPSLDAGMTDLASTPPPNSGYTIPPAYAAQVPAFDENNLSAGFVEPPPPSGGSGSYNLQ